LAQADLQIQDQLAIVTLDNGPQNRLSIEMLLELEVLLGSVQNSDARVLVVRANGSDFSFGGDIVPWADMTRNELRGLFERFMRIFNQFEQLAIPTIVATQGKCFGGGFELALRADMIFASQSAIFGHPEQSLGIVTLLGGVYRAAERAGRAKAIEWAMTSDPISAEEMARRGIVNRVTSDEALWPEALAFAEKLAKGPTLAHAAHKALLRIWATSGIGAADQAMFDIAMPLFETNDVKAALPASVKAFIEKQPRPTFPFTGS
jgi:enoyl-CoA hydratase/carnithine racemase